MNELPRAFVKRMEGLLGDEASAFIQELTSQPAQHGLRVNTLKTSVENFSSLFDVDLYPLPWTAIGFKVEEVGLGKHPLHAAGLFYLQEPSAMAVPEVLDPQPEERILDLAAAPGGKTTHLASMMENKGVLVANDPHGGRVQALARNLERWGTQHTIITQESPQRLADHFGGYFDRVLVDAPCSGEGTFRNDPGGVKHWTPNAVRRYANLQNEILWYAAQLVKPGGQLVYSTCTFSPVENEGSIRRLLQSRSDYEIKPIPESPGFSPGDPATVEGPPSLRDTVRIWPHKSPGEGHFIARLGRKTSANPPKKEPWTSPELSPEDRETYRSFVTRTLDVQNLPPSASPENPSLSRRGNRLYAQPRGIPRLNGLRVKHWGWWLGTYKGNDILPSHALAMGLPSHSFLDRIPLQVGDQDVRRYLRGLPLQSSGKEGWVTVTVEGFPLGWGKRTQNKVKSFSPRWLSQV